MPAGSPGPDGITVAWLKSLHSDALDALCCLLNLADAGRVPTFWAEARVTLIPKAADSPPGDLRPITVLSVVYRLWARRHAGRLNSWMAEWVEKGLVGGLPYRCAASASHRVTLTVDAARARRRGNLYVLTLDQSKCFDRLSLDTLSDIVERLDIAPRRAALANYRKLSRLMFLGGEPNPFLIHSESPTGLVGIPQGCPLAPVFAICLGTPGLDAC
eukprot:6563701-Alexandrium_andersonii.AAC.1